MSQCTGLTVSDGRSRTNRCCKGPTVMHNKLIPVDLNHCTGNCAHTYLFPPLFQCSRNHNVKHCKLRSDTPIRFSATLSNDSTSDFTATGWCFWPLEVSREKTEACRELDVTFRILNFRS